MTYTGDAVGMVQKKLYFEGWNYFKKQIILPVQKLRIKLYRKMSSLRAGCPNSGHSTLVCKKGAEVQQNKRKFWTGVMSVVFSYKYVNDLWLTSVRLVWGRVEARRGHRRLGTGDRHALQRSLCYTAKTDSFLRAIKMAIKTFFAWGGGKGPTYT